MLWLFFLPPHSANNFAGSAPIVSSLTMATFGHWPWPPLFNDISHHPKPLFRFTYLLENFHTLRSSVKSKPVVRLLFFLLVGWQALFIMIDKNLHCWMIWLIINLLGGTFFLCTPYSFTRKERAISRGPPIFKGGSRFQILTSPSLQTPTVTRPGLWGRRPCLHQHGDKELCYGGFPGMLRHMACVMYAHSPFFLDRLNT